MSSEAQAQKNGKNGFGSSNAFGTFKGVFLPSILTVFGVIMYLRMGWVLGNAGLIGTIAIITVSCVITFMTALSMSSISTNMEMRGGGAYFMISRSLGVEAGAAIGLSLFFAKAIGIAFYIAGFTESMSRLLPSVNPLIISFISLAVLTVLAYLSADIALKASLLIFFVIIASLVSFFMGGAPAGGFEPSSSEIVKVSFWTVFAVFFPAVTGIEAGLSMSGDLKNPSRALPIGTITAVIIGYVVYISIPIFLYSFVPEKVLLTNNMIIMDVARFRYVILAGIWGASLSSALGSLLGAPRTLQALARDRIVPLFLGKGHGDQDTPRIATALSFLIAFCALAFGNLDTIAPVLSMFFLTTYGSLNLVAGLESLIGNPSWRPTFRTHWAVSIIGAGLCIAAMFMINPGATFIAIFVVAFLFYITAKRGFNARWMDIRRSIHMALARYSIYKLADSENDVRSWRPNILVFSGSPQKRLYLTELADAFTHGKGFLTVASVIQGKTYADEKILSLEKTIREFLKERNIPALVDVIVAPDLHAGVKNMMATYGIGPLTPNTIVLGESEKPESFRQFAAIIETVYRARRNIVIVRESHVKPVADSRIKKISCWWGGKRHNAGLMLTLGFMLQTSPEWRGAQLSIKTIVRDEAEAEVTHKNIDGFLKSARLIAHPEVVVHEYDASPISTSIREASRDADLVMLGMRPPGEDETPEAYAEYYAQLMARTANFPLLAFVLASEDLKFQDIFV